MKRLISLLLIVVALLTFTVSCMPTADGDKAAIENANCELIKSVSVTDIYSDESGKSITTKLVFSDNTRTLTKEEVALVVDKITDDLKTKGIVLKNV